MKIKTVEHLGYEINIFYDEYPESPREWSNLGKMVCFSKKYNLGDKHDYNPSDYNGYDHIKDEIVKMEKAIVVLPLYLYVHSGMTISTDSFTCPWDSGQIGFIYATKSDIEKEYAIDLDSEDVREGIKEEIKDILISEVKDYDTYIRGEIYGYEIVKDGEYCDSCWGFYNQDEMIKDAKEAIESLKISQEA